MKETVDATSDPEMAPSLPEVKPLPIVTYPDQVLTQKAAPIEEVTDEIRLLAAQMMATLAESPTGVGLAAPQVGVSLRMTVIDPSFEPEAGLGEEPFALVNPEIIEEEGTYLDEEGCLSLPGLTYPVERPERIVLRYTTLEGEEQTLEASEFVAKLFCHELDHLDGILMWDRVSRFKRDWLKAKYKKSLKDQG